MRRMFSVRSSAENLDRYLSRDARYRHQARNIECFVQIMFSRPRLLMWTSQNLTIL